MPIEFYQKAACIAIVFFTTISFWEILLKHWVRRLVYFLSRKRQKEDWELEDDDDFDFDGDNDIIRREASGHKQLFPFFCKKRLLNMPQKSSDAIIRVSCGELADQYEIVITDCGSRILLHGYLYEEDSYNNCLFKIDTLVDTLTEFRTHIVESRKTVLETPE